MLTFTGVYPNAVQRPIGPVQLQRKINPTCVILHTMVGHLDTVDRYFHNNGFHGDFSHFGVGGVYDGALDGVVYQWQDTNYQANAQYSGNAYGISIETSDGGRSEVPWDDVQLNIIVDLVRFLCEKYDLPAELIKKPTDKGIGYHCQFIDWNKNHHTCPGKVRTQQLIQTVIPRVANSLFSDDEDDMYMIRTPDGEIDLVVGNKIIHLDGPGYDFYKNQGVRLRNLRQQDGAIVRK